MRKKLYINDIDISQYGIYISSDTYLNTPLIDYTEYQIPSRDGNVIQYNKRLNNVIRRFDCYIHDTHNIQTSLNQLKKILYVHRGYMKLQSDYDIGTYQYGYLAEEIEVVPFGFNNVASFSLYFSCLPSKYITNEQEYAYYNTLDGNFYKMDVFVSNDDLFKQIWLDRATNDYPISNFGWIYYNEPTTSNILSKDTDYVIETSSDIKKYMVFAVTYYANETSMVKDSALNFELIGEAENGNLTINYHTENYNDKIQKIGFFFPITEQGTIVETTGDYNDYSGLREDLDAIINCTATSSSNTKNFDMQFNYWCKYSNVYLKSDVATGNNLVIKGMFSFYEDYKTNIFNQFLKIGNCEIVINLKGLINDYGFDNFVETYLSPSRSFRGELNLSSNSFKAFDTNDNELVDLSNYVEIYGSITDLSEIVIYSACPSTSPVHFGIYPLTYPTKIKANWWAI